MNGLRTLCLQKSKESVEYLQEQFHMIKASSLYFLRLTLIKITQPYCCRMRVGTWPLFQWIHVVRISESHILTLVVTLVLVTRQFARYDDKTLFSTE